MSPADATGDRAERPRICFLAVEVPRTVAEGVADWARPLLDAAARAVEPDRFHVTLVYYGAVAADALGELTTEIAAHASGGELGLEPGPPGRFGRGRVLWVGLGGDVARLAALRRKLHDATGRFGKASAEPGEGSEAEFVPHITVARTRGRPRSERRFLASRPQWDASVRFVADRLTLFETAGGRYHVLAEFPLDDEDRETTGA